MKTTLTEGELMQFGQREWRIYRRLISVSFLADAIRHPNEQEAPLYAVPWTTPLLVIKGGFH